MACSGILIGWGTRPRAGIAHLRTCPPTTPGLSCFSRGRHHRRQCVDPSLADSQRDAPRCSLLDALQRLVPNPVDHHPGWEVRREGRRQPRRCNGEVRDEIERLLHVGPTGSRGACQVSWGRSLGARRPRRRASTTNIEPLYARRLIAPAQPGRAADRRRARRSPSTAGSKQRNLRP